jgi:hypothetical protein
MNTTGNITSCDPITEPRDSFVIDASFGDFLP